MSRKIWPKSSNRRVARSLHAHSILGLVVGGLIYILSLSGTLSVFNHDFQRWEQPGAPEMEAISPEAAAQAATTVFLSEDTPTTHLYINFPQPDLPRTVITTDTQAFFANPDGTIAERESFPWTQFLLDLHYYLHLPHVLGLTLVGAMGAFLLAMSMSGLMAHPRIFRDAFTFRRGSDRVSLADLHNRLSVWTAPFHISNALTGSILGLASILAFAIAATSYGGDTEPVFSPIFGEEPAPDAAPAPLAEIAGPLSYVAENFPEHAPTYFILHDPGTAGQNSSVILNHDDRLIFGEYYQFDGDGNYRGSVGMSDGTVGQQIIGSVYNVHFGNWGGVPVKLAYLVFGLSLCIITASGLRIYFTRKRDKGEALPRMEAAWESLVWGIPTLLALTRLVSLLGGEALLVPLFWFGLAGILAVGFLIRDAVVLRASLKIALTSILLLALLAHSLSHLDSLTTPAAWPVSIGLLLTAGLIGASLRVSATRRKER